MTWLSSTSFTSRLSRTVVLGRTRTGLPVIVSAEELANTSLCLHFMNACLGTLLQKIEEMTTEQRTLRNLVEQLHSATLSNGPTQAPVMPLVVQEAVAGTIQAEHDDDSDTEAPPSTVPAKCSKKPKSLPQPSLPQLWPPSKFPPLLLLPKLRHSILRNIKLGMLMI